jgi:hypothetical protein
VLRPNPIDRDEVDQAPVREHIRRYLRKAFALDDACQAAAKQRPAAPAKPQPAAETWREPNLLARRATRAMSHDERVRVALHDGSKHTGRIARWAPRPHGGELALDTGATLAISDVKAIATAEPPRRRRPHDRRLAACAHALGYRGHCLTKSRRYSTTFTALREARERHVHEQILARSQDARERALVEAAAGERIATFRYVGRGHLTTGDAFLAAQAAARAREHRQLAREAREIGQ